MNELMTTRELQELLKVDRITIYRMLERGQLPGFKIGGQWRFSRKEVENWLDAQRDSLVSVASHASVIDAAPDPSGLPLHCIQAMQDIFSEAVNLATVTVSANGEPLTPISRCSDFCHLVRSTEEGRRRCADSWKEIVPVAVSGGPVQRKCHAGLWYTAGAIEVGESALAVTVAGQVLFSPPVGEEWMQNCATVASQCGVSVDELVGASPSIPVHEAESGPRTMELLGRLVETFSEISHERFALLARLRKIAEISAVSK